ncbi:hypothetical protein [Amycolatopsis sp. NPDC059020]
MTDVDIRECRADDVPLLETHLPSPGDNSYKVALTRRPEKNPTT